VSVQTGQLRCFPPGRGPSGSSVPGARDRRRGLRSLGFDFVSEYDRRIAKGKEKPQAERPVMPIKPFDPSKLSVYPDHSTLCDAFKSNTSDGGGVSPAFRPLKGWIERVAHEASLCLSVYHLTELSRWDDRKRAEEMALWYEGLPVVLMRSVRDVEDEEAECWLNIATGGSSDTKRFAFASSLIAAFHDLTPGEIETISREAQPLLALLEAMRLRGNDADIDQFIAGAEAFRADRKWADAQGWDAARKTWQTAFNIRRALRAQACVLGRPFHPGRTGNDVLVRLYETNARALPRFRLAMAFNEGLAAGAARKGEGGAGLRKAYRGSFYDWAHLLGGAYCDVFTCDGEVSKWIGELRAGFGLRPQMTAKGLPPETFVRELMATWP
jgi:hypothetical protein